MRRKNRLQRNFFARPARIVAVDLLGKKIVRIFQNGKKLEGVITETEAYVGIKDKASHSHGGRRTKRNEVMYGEPGKIYVYFTYGMHWMLNFVVSEKGDPQAVLIRGIEGILGPGRVTKHFQIDKSFYGEDLVQSKRIWVEDMGIKYKQNQIKKLPRIGVNYSEEWKHKKLRFLIGSIK